MYVTILVKCSKTVLSCSVMKQPKIQHIIDLEICSGVEWLTRAVLRLVWPSILLQSARDRVATAAKTVIASRLWSAMAIKL